MDDAQEALNNYPSWEKTKEELRNSSYYNLIHENDYLQVLGRAYLIKVMNWEKKYFKKSSLTEKIIKRLSW